MAYLGQIKLLACNFAPQGWAWCDGSLMAISEYDALFALIGTTFGGDGVLTFALPDLRGRAPVHQGNGYVIGNKGGSETVTLTTNQMPAHTHGFLATNNSLGFPTATGTYIALSNEEGGAFEATFNGASIAPIGGSQPHDNMQPYLAMNYCICLEGIYPSPY
jgi:microcystin-dependent protein